MFANQLPLLELGSFDPPSGELQLETLLQANTCYLPLPSLPAYRKTNGPVEIVAFTDVNDALSYHLGEQFGHRCAPDKSALRLVNVTLPNALPRWFFVYSDLVKAHADGFKDNDRAVALLVDGYPAKARQQ